MSALSLAGELIRRGKGGQVCCREGDHWVPATTTGPADRLVVARPVVRDPLLDAVELHGAHDLRHTYATWMEDAGIPARAIDELMGHASSRGGLRGSAIAAHYRHTTPEMADRVVDAIQQQLTVVLGVAELVVESHPDQSTLRAFDRLIHCELDKHERQAE